MSHLRWPALFAGLFSITACNSLGNVSSSRQGFDVTPVPKAPFDTAFRAACGDGGISPDGEQAFLRDPYLQKMTTNSVEVLWTTASTDTPMIRVKDPSGVEIGQFAPRIDEQSDRPEFDQYVTSIEGLEPDSIYCYEIQGPNGNWLEATGFRTAPDESSERPIRIVTIGDLGTQTSDQFAVLDAMSNVEYDLVLVAGDLAYEKGTLSDHENNFFAVYSEVLRSVPFFVISGNHDYAADGAVFREVFSLPENGGSDGVERWYSFDWGNTHITALDTEQVNDVQAEWLDQDLAATDKEWKIAFLHRPPYSSGSHGSTSSVQNLFVPAFERYGVNLVLAGHDHDYERTQEINGVTYVVTGSAGRGTRPVGSSSFTEYSEAVAHFSHITMNSVDLSLHAIDATGADFDAVTLTP